MNNPLDKFLAKPENAIKTSHSEIETYTRCQRQHYYSYGRGLQSLGSSDALTRGTLGHLGLQIYYEHLKNNLRDKDAIEEAWFKQIIIASPKEDKTIAMEVVGLLQDYISTYWESDQELEILAVEQEFNIPVAGEFYIKMFVDLILRVPNSGIELWDHKFVYDFFNPAVEAVLPQLPKYLGACRSVGININKVRYNEIRYRNTKETEEDPSKRFHRTVVNVNKDRVIRTMREQIAAAIQIKNFRESGLENWDKSVLRAANSNICRNCPFLEICAADLRGEDTTLLEQFSYKKREADRNG